MARLLFKDVPGQWHTVDFPSVPLTQVSLDSAPDTPVAFVFFGHVNIDFDGSPTAYGPPGMQPPPDDDLGNAWNDKQGWFGVAALAKDDPAVVSGAAVIDTTQVHLGKYPVIQQAANQDPNPGFYVSATPHPLGEIYRQDSYIDASQVAFGALSGRLAALGVALGDHGLAIRHDQSLQSGFYFADKGGFASYALGECSHRVGKDLGGTGRARFFNNNYPVSFIVFPQSFTQDPAGIVAEPDDQIAQAIKSQLQALRAADNADDLVLLMGFNETDPQSAPRGTSKLARYRADPDNNPQPASYDNISKALSAWGG